MINFLKKLTKDWRDAGDSPTLANHQRVRSAYYRCADELDAMLGAVEALGKFIKGNGVGLPHGTVAWVIHDSKRYIREWHPMAPDNAGKPLGNWWALEEGGGERFNEDEVTHYSIIEVPLMPGEVPRRAQRKPESEPIEFQAVVGEARPGFGGKFVAFTSLADLREGTSQLVTAGGDTEEEALHNLRLRCDAVLRTFFNSYKTVRI